MKSLVSTLCFLLIAIWIKAHDHVLPPGFFMEENYVTGLSQPTDLVFAPDGRIFITEKAGQVRIVENGELLDQSFYSVHTQTPNERGLDGIVLDPDFDNNGYVYLFYTLPFENHNIVARVTAAGNAAVPGSEIELFRMDRMWGAWHNGAGMAFDSTGKLVFGSGDGTAGPSAPRMTSTLGKMLRINPDGSIPTDNPFYNQNTDDYRAIAAYGLRNPYTMAVSPSSGRIFFNDVGYDDFEEVNEFIMGKNYGWNRVEGMLNGAPPPDSNYMDPVHVYDHGFGCAVVGAAFYEPDINLFPTEYFGKYFFLEYCKGYILCMDPDSFRVEVFGSGLKKSYNNVETSPDGYLYLINFADGNLARISYQGINSPPLISIQPQAHIVPVGANIMLSVESTGDTLLYDWYRNGNLVHSSGKNTLFLNNLQLVDDQTPVFVRVTNPHGYIDSDTILIEVVDGTPPIIQFGNIPTSFAAEDTLHFSATVSDPDQAEVPLSALTWRIDFHHGEHIHPAISPLSGTASGSYYAEPFGEVDPNVFLRIHLEVKDSSGLVTDQSIDVQPEKVNMILRSQPEGVEVSVDGSKEITDYWIRSVKNLRRTIEIPSYSIIGDSLYQFLGWQDGVDSLLRIFSATNRDLSLSYQSIDRYYHGISLAGNRFMYSDTGANGVPYRIGPETEVNRNWDVSSPYPWDQPPFPKDYFGVRWEGSIIVPVTGLYTFYLFHDSKVSFTLGDSLLIDGSIAAGALQEDTVQIWLLGGDSLGLSVDYDHYTYIARVELDWSYSLVERYKVPFMQHKPIETIPEPPDTTEIVGDIVLFPNPVSTGPNSDETVSLYLRPALYDQERLIIRVYDLQGRLVFKQLGTASEELVSIPVSDLPKGLYWVKVIVGIEDHVLKLLIF